ncbi:nucleotidyltransferase domain-containing protein [Sulfurimonas sp.]|uniref:nucleotidyltransferase domain-containing protein n=1 Tax=Sulfurimonas sp. TaxID=2022749 RepID=UPI002AB1EDA0|nr:nucleotidyltransferase domain-containing protein [Sulfurimonas sp.]
MIDIEKIKVKIVDRLKSLNPDKIILFGSYAYGSPNKDSDIDLYLVQNVEKEKVREYKLKARKLLRDIVFEYGVGFDILNSSQEFLTTREDYFYKIDILEKGKVLYAK